MTRKPHPDSSGDPGLDLVETILPPHSVEAEQAILGMLIGGATLCPPEEYKLICMETCTSLRPDDFYRGPHRYIFEAIQFLVENNEEIDIVKVGCTLEDYRLGDAAGGRCYLMDLAMSVSTIQNIQWYINRIKNDSIRRQVITAGNHMAHSGYEILDAAELIQKAQQSMILIADRQYEKDVIKKVGESAHNVVTRIGRARADKKPLMGILTGWNELDTMLWGWQRTDLIIVAARPSMGKTAFALNTASSIAMDLKKPVLYFSLEMSEDQLTQRLLSQVADVDSFEIRTGVNISDDEFRRLQRAERIVNEAPLYIDDTASMSPMQMKVKINQLKLKLGTDIGMVVVDYLQLMEMEGFRGGGDNRVAEVTAISRALKNIAKDCNVPVLALSQLSRACEAREDKRPVLSDLRESGSIEQDADVVIALYRDEHYYGEKSKDPGMAEIIVRKQRNGPIGTVKLMWSPKRTQFIGKKGVIRRCYAD